MDLFNLSWIKSTYDGFISTRHGFIQLIMDFNNISWIYSTRHGFISTRLGFIHLMMDSFNSSKICVNKTQHEYTCSIRPGCFFVSL